MSQAISVLLVDDNDDDVVIIQDAFAQEQRFTISNVAHDGQEAMAFLNKQGKYADSQEPSMVLLDINMPKMNGFEVLQAIKSSPRLQHLPIIMLTTSNREEDITRSYAYGACSYIQKPSSLQSTAQFVTKFVTYWADVAKLPPVTENY